MKFKPVSTKMARLWVDAFAASVGMSKSDSAIVYANLCGFKTWEYLVRMIEAGPPSVVDEDMEEFMLNKRKDGYINILTSMHSISEFHAFRIIDQMSPSSNKTPRKFSFDSESMYEQDHDGIPLFDPTFGGKGSAGIDSQILSELGIDLSLVPDIGLTDDSEKIRLLNKPDPSVYFNFFGRLGYKVIDSSYSEDYKFGEPSFAIDSSYGKIPVYATSLTQTPLDTQDFTSEKVKSIVLDNSVSLNFQAPVILMWGKALTRTVKGRSFVCVGAIYIDGFWRDLIIGTSFKSVEDLVLAHSMDIDYNNPPIGLSDDGEGVMKLYLALSNGFEDYAELAGFSKHLAGGASGWSVVMILPKGMQF